MMNNERGTVTRFTKYQLPLILYAGLIFAVSSLSKVPTPDFGFTYIDKIVHMAEYLLFALLAIRAFTHVPTLAGGIRVYIIAVAISLLFAASDEFHQSFTPGRQADVYDLVADVVGVFLAAFLHYTLRRMRSLAS